jgi:hypothetical protein
MATATVIPDQSPSTLLLVSWTVRYENHPNDFDLAFEAKIVDDHMSECGRQFAATGESSSDA